MSKDSAASERARKAGSAENPASSGQCEPDSQEPSSALALRREIERLRHDQARLRRRLESVRQTRNKNDGDARGHTGSENEDDEHGGPDSRADDDDPDSDSRKAAKAGGDQKTEDNQQAEKDGGNRKRDKNTGGGKPPVWKRAPAWLRNHPLGAAGFLVALVVLIVASVMLLRYLGSYQSTDDAEIDGHLDPITSRINGTVLAVHVDNNQSVVAGEALVDLDISDYRVATQQAQANLAEARGQLEAENPTVPITETSNATTVSTTESDVTSAIAAVGQAEHDYQAALADLRQAEANNVQAQVDESRYRELVEKDETTKEFYGQKLAQARADNAAVDSKRAAAEAARRVVTQRQAALEQARTRLVEAKNNNPRQVFVRRAQVQSRQAAVDAAQSQLDQAQLNQSYCNITAPVPGIVGNRTVEVGQRVQAGEQLLAVTKIDDLWVTANFKETELNGMHPGQRVTIHVDSLSRDFNGYVDSMPGATGAKYSLLPPENATGNYVKVVQRLPVRIRFLSGQDGLDLLRPGMSVEPKVWIK